MSAWNPRFVAYAAAHGNTPEGQLADDDGIMAGFTCWLSGRMREWRAETGASGWLSDAQQSEFGVWLDKAAA